MSKLLSFLSSLRRLSGAFFVLFFVCHNLNAEPLSLTEVDEQLKNIETNMYYQRELAKSLVQETASRLEKLPMSHRHARLLNLEAHIFILELKLNKAYEKATLAEKIAIESNSVLEQAESLRRQGLVHFLLGDETKALALFSESLKMHQSLDSQYIVTNMHNIATVYAQEQTWAEDLIAIGHDMIALARQKASKKDIADAYCLIIEGYLNNLDYEAAKRIGMENSDEINESATFPHTLPTLMARAEIGLGNYGAAMVHINNARRNAIDLVLVTTEIDVLEARVLQAHGKVQEALHLLEHSLEQAKLTNVHQTIDITLEALYEFHLFQSDYKEALKHFTELAQIRQEEYESREASQLAFSRAQLDVQRLNYQSELYNKLLKAEKAETFWRNIALLTLFALTLTVLLLLLRSTRQKNQFKTMSLKDELTGAPNRRAVLAFLEEHAQKSSNGDPPLSVIVLDIDHFKNINDSYGHDVGDDVICSVVTRAKQCIRPEDQIGRVGGEEFLIVLPGVSPQQAEAAAERIRQAVADKPHTSEALLISVSLGVASRLDKESIPSLLKRSDEYLYQAKDKGRNQVMWERN